MTEQHQNKCQSGRKREAVCSHTPASISCHLCGISTQTTTQAPKLVPPFCMRPGPLAVLILFHCSAQPYQPHNGTHVLTPKLSTPTLSLFPPPSHLKTTSNRCLEESPNRGTLPSLVFPTHTFFNFPYYSRLKRSSRHTLDQVPISQPVTTGIVICVSANFNFSKQLTC